MREHLAGGISLQQVSAACRLSPSAFVRAFKKSLGITPHQWLLSRRIEYADDLLSDGSLSLVEVALAAGFGDQSHFTRIFTRRVGVSPGAYRRAHCTQAA
nr:helix-turn-helix transcriptional regulator [Dyella sp. RRB7]